MHSYANRTVNNDHCMEEKVLAWLVSIIHIRWLRWKPRNIGLNAHQMKADTLQDRAIINGT